MQIDIRPGKYVVAVSGGVDSMVLLDLLRRLPGLELTIAHFDHGVRPDSAADRRLVQDTAEHYSLPFVYEEVKLGLGVSEDVARQARYGFLRELQKKIDAQAIITAHHQDDMLETALINMLRGTGRKGLSSLQSRPGMLRPLLNYPKNDLLNYARQNGIVWHEDSTNQDDNYLRNKVRQILMPRLGQDGRSKLKSYIDHAADLNQEIGILLNELLAMQADPNCVSRGFFIQLPYKIACEYMAQWLRTKNVEFDKRTIDRLVVFCMTAKPGKQADAGNGGKLVAAAKDILFQESRI
ncbi:MAG TPA: tRNA lysidine(34) synthetase TilS [Patescibacteria group bacterium]|nr:tRNA lysidine(34) synthetase TilS [Patescibacteria group bacterium]